MRAILFVLVSCCYKLFIIPIYSNIPINIMPKTDSIKVGIGQMLVIGGEPERNLNNAVQFIEDAAKKGCDVIVLPECLDFGWTNSKSRKGAHPIPGVYSDKLAKAATENRIFVVAGLTEREESHLYNTAILISPGGSILAKHRKINILDIASDLYTPGSQLQVTPTEIGNIGINICADNAPNAKDLGRALGYMGADMILSPCAWAVPPDHDNEKEPYGEMWKNAYTEIAKAYKIPVVGVSNTGTVADGPWKDWNCIGASLVVSWDGKIQKQFDYTATGQELYVIEIALNRQDK
jgi:predicted amidohydrolase